MSESEKRVMEVLWQESPISSLTVTERVSEHQWSEKTVRTFLNRLVKKDLVSYVKEGRRYLYSPLIKRRDYVKQESTGLLTNVFGGDIKELLATFVRDQQLSDDEVTYLKNLLKKKNGGDQ